MIIWLNGAFGVGKTQTAHELGRRVAGAYVSDPEVLGFALHRMLPGPARGDFQDLPEWREGVRRALRRAAEADRAPLIVPMTLVRDEYFDEIIGGLRADGVDVRHYALVASPATLRRRLQRRSAYVLGKLIGRDETWGIQQIERCVRALEQERYATHVDTENRSIAEVAEHIAADLGLPLVRPRLGPIAAPLTRLGVAVRHIRT
ncbi:AAA family ATPase [Ammonicoccus fulvus]|uniref:AAA family ATPase n=1 Tax=Ammonicoccus fulvus TaxID=3138240 RepID=A0ABZ3FIT2_9ACTN